MAIEIEDLLPEAPQPGDKMLLVRGSGAGATVRVASIGSAAIYNAGSDAGQIPVLDATGKIPAARLPASPLAPLRQPAASFAAGFVLEAGRIGYETDTHKLKMGDGGTVWSFLPYSAGSSSGGVSGYGDLTGIPDTIAAIDGLTPAADGFAYYTGASTAAMGTITANARGLLAAADYAAMKALLDLEIGTDVEKHSAYAVNAGAAATLLPAADRSRTRHTHAAPVLTIAAQSAQAYPDGFVCAGHAASGMTITAAAGVTLNGASGGSVAVAAISAGGAFTLARLGPDAWLVATPPVVTPFARTMLDDADADAARATLALGAAALLDAEDVEEATCYHVLTGTAHGMVGDGVAADRLASASLEIAPVAGDVTHLYPLDPASSAEPPEVAEDQANRPLNAHVALTSANSAADAHWLIYPDPADAAVLLGLENRVTQTRLINADAAATLTVGLAPSAPGRRPARWRGALANVALAPGDELLARAHWFGGKVTVDQIARTVDLATIALVARSAGTTSSPISRNTPNVLADDLVIIQCCRIGGTAIALPSGMGYSHPTAAPYGSDGRLIQATPNRATRVAWTFATADGTHASGSFSGATSYTISGAYRNIGGVRQIVAAYGDASVSIAWPALPLARAPGSWVIGLVNSHVLSTAVTPTGATVDASYNQASGNSIALWHYAAGEAYAPPPTTVASCNWAVTVIEVTPRAL